MQGAYNRRQIVRVSTLLFASLFSLGSAALAQPRKTLPSFPVYLSNNFDYARFTHFDAPAPPKDGIYQSNGFLALMERDKAFGGQVVSIPAPVNDEPNGASDLLGAVDIDAPIFVDRSNGPYDFSYSPAKRHVTYYADRTVYRAEFDVGPDVSLTVYPVYGKAAAVLRINVEKAVGPIRTTVRILDSKFRKDSQKPAANFQMLPVKGNGTVRYGSSRWPYRLLVGASSKVKLQERILEWDLRQGGEAAAVVALGGTEGEAEAVLQAVKTSRDLFDHATHKAWNDYLASTPLVIPAGPIKFTIGTTGEQGTIMPEDLVRSELWFWRGLLSTTCQVRYMPASPLVLADWFGFNGMWGNDGVSESMALSATGRKDIARASLLNWFRYAVNARGDGNSAWIIFTSGRSNFDRRKGGSDMQSVPLQASLVGQYVRLTGDAGILDEKPGGVARDRTVWQSLLAYQRNLRKVRDINDDHLIDWTHTFETGWDDKNSPFVDNKGAPTSAMNEQVFNLWSLQEMVYLCKLRGEDASPWQEEFAAAKQSVLTKLWDPETQRYWDLDISTGKLWTQGENLDAYYFLYYESDPARIAAMMKRLTDPAKFNGPLLPTLAFDTPNWGGYWRGLSWPREYSYFALALSRAGQSREAFTWLARAISSNLGPILPETIDPKKYPHEHNVSGVRIMGYDALDTAAFADVAGLRIWAGHDLTVAADAALGKVYVRGQKWMGDSYDALFEPGRPTRIWRNGQEMKPLPTNQVWRAQKKGRQVSFDVIHANASSSQP